MSISSIASTPALPPPTVSAPSPVQASAPVPISEANPIKVAVQAATVQASASQEATETPDVTRKEAAKGDRQALKLLAKETSAQSPGGKQGLKINA